MSLIFHFSTFNPIHILTKTGIVRNTNDKYIPLFHRKKERKQERKKERKKERKCICPNANYKLVELPVGVNECDHIRKLLNKNHMGKVPSKAGKYLK